MAVSNIKAEIDCNIEKVWEIVTSVDKYSWRSDLSRTEIVNDKQFIEYAKNGFSTKFSVTISEQYKRWEFDIDNDNINGHWTGIFKQKGNKTEIDFTEEVFAKKIFMKPFLKGYLKKQQAQFISDLKKAL
ncbi:MAG: SRPBCC family protein [Oscillospiraceae bacterium]|nr:SRPBCC family protein [Oscillospiraceae bacterium]